MSRRPKLPEGSVRRHDHIPGRWRYGTFVGVVVTVLLLVPWDSIDVSLTIHR